MKLARSRERQSSPDEPAVRLVHVATVPQTLGFFRGHVGYLSRHGFKVHAVSSPGAPLDEFGQLEGVSVFPVPMSRRPAPGADVVSLWRLYRLFRAIRPDIVHSHTPKAGLLGTLAARAAGVPHVLLSVFGLPQMTSSGPTRFVLDGFTRVACGLADRVWCDSHSMRDYVVACGLSSPRKTIVLGKGSVSGVDAEGVFCPDRYGLQARQALRHTYEIPDKALVLGFVGRIVKDKGIRELLASWRVLRERYPELHMLVVGPFERADSVDPVEESLLKSDPRIHLAGQRSDVALHMSAMDVFAMPSYREGFGVTNIEAAAMSLPVVSTDIPGCVDSVQHGVTGTLVAPRDGQALAQAIRAYLDSPDLRQQHGAAGRQRVLRDFRPQSIWQSLLETYLDLLPLDKRRSPAGLEGSS